jgi:TonB family protein
MKIISIWIFLSLVFLSCSSEKPVIRSMNCSPPDYTIYKGEVLISSYKITNRDSLNLFITNSDSLIKKIVYPDIAERAGVEGNVTIKFNLDSNRVAKNIEFTKRLGAGFEEAILRGLKNFKFKFANGAMIEDLKGILVFKFKLYPQGTRVF